MLWGRRFANSQLNRPPVVPLTQTELLKEMLAVPIEAIIIKACASLARTPRRAASSLAP